jgi:hypothetical protein
MSASVNGYAVETNNGWRVLVGYQLPEIRKRYKGSYRIAKVSYTASRHPSGLGWLVEDCKIIRIL